MKPLSIEPADFTATPDLSRPRAAESGEKGFGETLLDAVSETNRLLEEKADAVRDLATNPSPDIHNAMITMQKAEVSVKLMVQVRNKIVQAYEEIMRMNV